MFDYIDGFRYGYETADVFVEDDHYLYVEATPYEWAHAFTCNEYRLIDGVWWRSDTSGASLDYIATLEKAPENVMDDICTLEYELDIRADGCAAAREA